MGALLFFAGNRKVDGCTAFPNQRFILTMTVATSSPTASGGRDSETTYDPLRAESGDQKGSVPANCLTYQ